MSIFESSNPLDWAALDGIYIDESAPPPNVQGVPTNVAIVVGQFERGPAGLTPVGSSGVLFEDFGNNLNYSGLVSLQNKKFGTLNVLRVVASGAAAATKTFQHSSTDIISFSAIYKGAYGNNITVKIEAGSVSGKKYTVHDGNLNAVLPDEVYDNVAVASISPSSNPFKNSKLIVASVIATSNEPDNIIATALLTGSDGSVADTDYLAAINKSQVSGAGNVIFLDAYNSTRNGYLKSSMAATKDKMAILAGQSGDSVSTAISDVANYRDTDGRMIYAFPYVTTNIGGADSVVCPASFYASLLSQIAPNIDPAYAGNVQFLSGITSLVLDLQRSDYISLAAAGISAFEQDQVLGIKIKSGVVTQIANSSKIMVFRRRMADFLVQSVGRLLLNYENAPNSSENQTKAISAISGFNTLIENEKLVPKDAEVQNGKASLIDGKSLNTNDSIAAGYFKILWRRRIYSSMRYIVLQAEIGESVVVTEQG